MSFAHTIASVLTPYLSEILAILSRDFTVCFLTELFVSDVSFVTIFGFQVEDESDPIRINPVSDI